MASLSSLHPFRKVMIARDTPNIPETEFVLSVGGPAAVNRQWCGIGADLIRSFTPEFG